MNDQYEVKRCAPNDLSRKDMDRCIAIVIDGDAVDPESAAIELPVATVLAVAYKGREVVGVGAIKRLRIQYAKLVSDNSHFPLPSDMQELGYVAVCVEHRRQGLSHRIVAQLLLTHVGGLFATTPDPFMRRTLAGAGFERKGDEWHGRRGTLSLWVRTQRG